MAANSDPLYLYLLQAAALLLHAPPAGGTQLDSSVGTGTYIPRPASRPCRRTEGIHIQNFVTLEP
jgi:hypothetical protein